MFYLYEQLAPESKLKLSIGGKLCELDFPGKLCVHECKEATNVSLEVSCQGQCNTTLHYHKLARAGLPEGKSSYVRLPASQTGSQLIFEMDLPSEIISWQRRAQLFSMVEPKKVFRR